MDRPLEISFRNMKPSAALKEVVEEQGKKLEHIYQHIIGCRVTIEIENHTHNTGHIPDVQIDIQVPGQDLVVHHRHRDGGDALTAVHAAFDAMALQLREYKARKNGHGGARAQAAASE